MFRQPPPYRPPPSPIASPSKEYSVTKEFSPNKEYSPTKEAAPPVPPRRRSSEKIKLIESNDNIIVNSKDNYVSKNLFMFLFGLIFYAFVFKWFKLAQLDGFAFFPFHNIVFCLFCHYLCFAIACI